MNQTADTEVYDTAKAREHFDQGKKAEQAGDRLAAIEAYEQAYEANPDDAEICFRLAYSLDLVGEEDEAITLYEQAVDHERPHLNALLNLAVLYEDRNQLAQAEKCLRQVLSTEPNHERAQLYLKDVLASKGMIVNDDLDRINEKHNALLDTPVTDFELSVRTRNAIKKMNIRTLGDLLKITEAEIRSFKNFGDASLEEIRAMLAQKGLRLGAANEQHQEDVKQQVIEQVEENGADQELLGGSVQELDLSVRARKALSLLNVNTIGELLLKTEAELMGVKNFGMTSLVEIKEKLEEKGLSLRSLDK